MWRRLVELRDVVFLVLILGCFFPELPWIWLQGIGVLVRFLGL